MIHNTLTDTEGNEFKIVSNWWMKALTGLCILNFVVLMLIIAGLIDNIRRVEATMSFSDKMTQRNQAVSDIAGSRALANIWAFEETCKIVKQQGRECMANPKWYADPNKYPLLVDDVAGAGLFPPK